MYVLNAAGIFGFIGLPELIIIIVVLVLVIVLPAVIIPIAIKSSRKKHEPIPLLPLSGQPSEIDVWVIGQNVLVKSPCFRW